MLLGAYIVGSYQSVSAKQKGPPSKAHSLAAAAQKPTPQDCDIRDKKVGGDSQDVPGRALAHRLNQEFQKESTHAVIGRFWPYPSRSEPRVYISKVNGA